MKGNSDNSILAIHVDSNTILTSDIDKAEAFNIFFSTASHLDEAGAQLPDNLDPLPNISILDNVEIWDSEVMDQSKTLDINKGYGPDGISPVFVKMGAESLVKP